MDTRGQNSGQPGWGAWIDALVEEQGTLTAVAQRLASARGNREAVESVERALRRLRGRGPVPGGVWGERLLRVFGLPDAIDARLRFMGSYHARFVDLPVPLCRDLVQLWDRPPTSDSVAGRFWIGLARATLALRARELDEAARLLDALRPGAVDAHARAEHALARAVSTARAAPAVVPVELAPVEAWLADVAPADAACLRARLVGQIAHAWNRAGRHADAAAIHEALPDGPEVPAFARSRRANGLSYARLRLGDVPSALVHARAAARHAGDAGHVRLRAMALLQLARTTPDTDEGRDARERARAIAVLLADATLLTRVERGEARP